MASIDFGTTTGPAPTPPLPMNLSHHYSKLAKHRVENVMKKAYKFIAIPGMGNLAGGLPNVQFFPFDTLEAQVARPDRWTPTPNNPEPEADEVKLAGKLAATKVADPTAAAHVTVPKRLEQPDLMKKVDLETALQYGTAEGYPPLRSFLRQFARDHLHPNIPYLGGAEIILTCGSTDGFSKTVELLVDPWYPETDPVEDRPGMLCEVFVYGTILSQVQPKGVQVVPVEIDSGGMLADGPGGLEDVLGNWDPRNGRRPHFMYAVTMGHNPTGWVLSVQRRKELYAVCSKYDVVIVEDDPYWYLQFPSAAVEEARSRGQAPPVVEEHVPSKSSGFDYIDSLTPSFLSVDTDGRVIRLDTFSKTVAPGCRLGWITAQPALIERFQRITEATTQQPSGFVQGIVAEAIMGAQPTATASFRSLSHRDRLLFTGWQMDGWVRWLSGLRGSYERRMNRMCSMIDDGAFQLKQSTPVRDADSDWGVITKTRLISFDWPRGGMFVWVRVHFEEHPLWQAKGESLPVLDGPTLATALFVYVTHKPFLVLAAPGSTFAATPEVLADRAWAYLRLCFAAVADEAIPDCTERFVSAVQKFWRIKDVKEIEELVEELSGSDVEALSDVGFPLGC